MTRRSSCVQLLLGALLVIPLSGASLTPMKDLPRTLAWPKMRVPKWRHGALVALQSLDKSNHLIWVDDGQNQHSIPFTINGATAVLVYDWDRGTDGTVCVSGTAIDSEGRASGFVAFSADERVWRVIRTQEYRPVTVAVSSDGSVWSEGSEFHGTTFVPDASVIRHFGSTGQLSRVICPQSTISDPIGLEGIYNRLVAGKDHIVWYSSDRKNPAKGRYMEVSLAGTILVDLSVKIATDQAGHRFSGFAVTDEGQAFLSTSI